MDLGNLTIRDIALLTKLPSTTSLRVLASSMGVEPSNLSRTVKLLEEQLGIQLLHRSNLGVTATPEARVVAKKAAEICEAVRDLSVKTSAAKRPFERFINFGSRGFVNTYVAPRIVTVFADDSPEEEGIGMRFFDLSPDESQGAARVGVIDALIGFEDSALGKNWQQIQVGELSWRLYARPRNPFLVSGEKLDLFALRVGHHCSFDGKSAVFSDGLLFDSQGIRQVGHGAQSAYTALAIASATDQLACVPEIVAASMVAENKIVEVRLDDVTISTPVYLSVHSERIQQRELRLIRTALKAMF